MKYIFTILLALASLTSFCQDVMSVHPVYITINNENPKNKVYEFGDISIKFKKIDLSSMEIEIYNNSGSPIEFLKRDSYSISNGQSSHLFTPFEVKQVDYQSVKHIIAPNSFLWEGISAGPDMFHLQKAKKHFKENGKPLENKLILLFDDNKKVELVFQNYPSKPKSK